MATPRTPAESVPRPTLQPPRKARPTHAPHRLLVAFLALSAAACGQEAEPPPLSVGGVAYAEEDLLGLDEERRALLAELTAFALAVAREETDRMGAPLLERRRREILGRLFHAERSLDSMGVQEALLRDHYRRAPEWELTVRHLIALSPRTEETATRREARAHAVRALERIRAGEPFPEVAAEVSDEPGAEARQGLLQPGRRGAWVPEFWDAAEALRVGEVSPVVETRYGFHVLRLEGRDTVPYEDARPRVLLSAAQLMGLGDEQLRAPAPPPADLSLDLETLDRVEDPQAPDSLPVATWAGGDLTLGDFRDHLAVLPLREWRILLDGDVQRRLQAAREAVGLRTAADSARARRLAVPSPAEADLVRAWGETADRWATLLGFTTGGDAEAVKTAAREALRATRQNATLARQQLHQQAPLVLRAYDVRVRTEPSEGSPSPGTGQ